MPNEIKMTGLRFILNPASGHNRKRLWLADFLRAFIRSQRISGDVVTTQGPGHATEIAAAAVREGVERVVVVGGDGTMNEVAQALLDTPAVLGMVPCGSGNGLALHLGIPLNLKKALALAGSPAGRTKLIDSGSADGRPFFNVMGIGLDAEVSRRFNTLKNRGVMGYARTALGLLGGIRPERVRLGGVSWETEMDVFLVAVANSNQYGNHAQIAPGALVDDGELDLVAVQPVGLFGAAELAARLFAGSLNRSRHIRRVRSHSFWIERAGPGLMHTDGETFQTGARINVIVRPKSLRVLVSNIVAAPFS